jgi:hypothetical protein
VLRVPPPATTLRVDDDARRFPGRPLSPQITSHLSPSLSVVLHHELKTLTPAAANHRRSEPPRAPRPTMSSTSELSGNSHGVHSDHAVLPSLSVLSLVQVKLVVARSCLEPFFHRTILCLFLLLYCSYLVQKQYDLLRM